jgi:WhiB family redox-sensing transcriptional regulator
MLSVETRNWARRAMCQDLNTEDFYPQRGESTVHIKMICRSCPVVKPCLEYSMRNMEKFGIWGGTSERERRKMRTARARNAKADMHISITNLIKQFGINLSTLDNSELDDFSGEDGYV